MLKLKFGQVKQLEVIPAAFGRLCVETKQSVVTGGDGIPAAFGRLCVETSHC